MEVISTMEAKFKVVDFDHGHRPMKLIHRMSDLYLPLKLDMCV